MLVGNCDNPELITSILIRIPAAALRSKPLSWAVEGTPLKGAYCEVSCDITTEETQVLGTSVRL